MKNFFKRVVWMQIIIMMSAIVQAQQLEGNTLSGLEKVSSISAMDNQLLNDIVVGEGKMGNFCFSTSKINVSEENVLFSDRMQIKRPVRKIRTYNEGETLYTVKCVLEGEDYPSFAIFNPDFFEEATYSGYMESGETDTYYFQVPAGTYDIHTSFTKYENGVIGYVNIIHEDIVVDKNMEVIFSEDEATERIVMKPLLRDGRESILPTLRYLDQEPWVEYDYTNSNTKFRSLYSLLVREGCELLTIQGMRETVVHPGWNEELVFLNNKLSNKYHMIFEYAMLDDEGEFQISITDNNDFNSGDLHNYNMDYIKYDLPYFSKTPLNIAYGEPDEKAEIGCEIWFDELKCCEVYSYTDDSRPEIYWTSNSFPKDINIKAPIRFKNIQAQKTILDEFGDETDVYGEIACLPAIYEDGHWNYINRHHSVCGNYGYQISPEDNSVLEYPGIPAYCYFADQITQPIGNSSPILSVMSQVNVYPDVTIFSFDPNAYIGRYGEVRNCDLWTQQIQVKLDDKLVFDNADGGYLYEWCYDNSTDGHEKGIIEATFIDANVLVDETIPGFNHTTITVDERNEDLCTPTPQMLIFKNTAGAITDRFEKAEDGVIEFSAGDFNWFDNGQRHGYTCEEADVKVEYTPYGEDNFMPLEVEEIPENYYMPGFGHFYRGSLKDVTQKSANGWFDVRFTLTDKAGNRMVQRVSPAFRIDSNVGVAGILVDGLQIDSKDGIVTVCGGEIAVVELYGLDGQLLGATEGYALDANGYRGLAIVKVRLTDGSTTTAKIIVR